jgi:DEAD/DEAH box helicase domain-containing protein
VPHQHQATAFERLARPAVVRRQPTLVTTGTGSGKTECFLYPILDHCARHAGSPGEPGVKALILYPMNALASDQAGRIAELIHGTSPLAGL